MWGVVPRSSRQSTHPTPCQCLVRCQLVGPRGSVPYPAGSIRRDRCPCDETVSCHFLRRLPLPAAAPPCTAADAAVDRVLPWRVSVLSPIGQIAAFGLECGYACHQWWPVLDT